MNTRKFNLDNRINAIRFCLTAEPEIQDKKMHEQLVNFYSHLGKIYNAVKEYIAASCKKENELGEAPSLTTLQDAVNNGIIVISENIRQLLEEARNLFLQLQADMEANLMTSEKEKIKNALIAAQHFVNDAMYEIGNDNRFEYITISPEKLDKAFEASAQQHFGSLLSKLFMQRRNSDVKQETTEEFISKIKAKLLLFLGEYENHYTDRIEQHVLNNVLTVIKDLKTVNKDQKNSINSFIKFVILAITVKKTMQQIQQSFKEEDPIVRACNEQHQKMTQLFQALTEKKITSIQALNDAHIIINDLKAYLSAAANDNATSDKLLMPVISKLNQIISDTKLSLGLSESRSSADLDGNVCAGPSL